MTGKRLGTWLLALVVLALLASGAWRVMAARKAQQEALVQATKARSEAVLMLQKSELLTLTPQAFSLDLPISGSLQALSTALIKARIPGELQALALREGDRVRAGQIIARIDDTEARARQRQAQQQAQAARAQVDIAQRQFDNNNALVAQGFISPTALQSSQANLQAAQAQYQAAVAAVDVAHKALTDAVLTSPIAGQIAQRFAQNGERLGVDGRIVEVVDLTALELQALLPPQEAAQVRLGQRAQLSIEGSSASVPAEVVRINPSAQPGSRALAVYLRIDSAAAGAAEPLLRQGVFAQGLLHIGSALALAVPLNAVRTDKPEPYVQVMENGQIAHRSVQLGARSRRGDSTWVAIAKGLDEGAQIVIGTLGALQEGARVRAAGEPSTPASASPSAPSGAPAPAAPAQ